jgi:hypothetical protein
MESDGKDPETCQPVQLAAIMYHSRKLTPLRNGTFNLVMKPEGIDKDEYFTDSVMETIRWHAGNYECSTDEIIAKWKKGCDQKFAWQQFVRFIKRFTKNDKVFHAPIPCGIYIKGFDLPITDRLNEKYKIPNFFWLRDAIDIIPLCFIWFENLKDSPHNFRMDTLRKFFGLPEVNAHDALQDVRDEAEVIRRFLLLTRQFSPKVKFKGALHELDKTESVSK